jgi:hypothetical protein
LSPRALPRRAQISWSPPSECEDPAGGVWRIWLVGKQTTNSNRTASATPSFPAELSPHSVIFHRACREPHLSRQAGYLASLRYTYLTSSAKLRLLRSTSNMTLVRFAHKPFTIHELPSSSSTRGLTGLALGRYIVSCRGRSKRSRLTESRNGPLTRLSPEIVECAVLTFCEIRSTTRRLSAQEWSVSRPESATPNLVIVQQLEPLACPFHLIVLEREGDSKPTSQSRVPGPVRHDGESSAISANSRNGLRFGEVDLAGFDFVSGT